MARQRGITVENNFIQGLITETPALSFPEKACTDTYDCVFSRTGKVSRRLGFNTETSSTPYSVSYVSGQATVEYLWTAVGGLGSKTMLVVQQADKLLFYNVSDTGQVSPNRRAEVIDLDTYLPGGSSKVPATYPCSFAQGNGDLIVCNEATSPFYIAYTATTDTLAATAITVKFRDFLGVTSEVSGLSTRPTESVATLKSTKPKHYYNLLNQGWYANDALSQWDTALTSMPSMADVPALYRNSETDSFDTSRVGQKDPGNVPAPKGHFILTAWDHDRVTAMTNDGFTGASFTATQNLIAAGSGSIIFSSYWTGNPATAAFDGTTSQLLGSSAWGGANSVSVVSKGLGKTLASATKISKAVVYGSNNEGFVGAGSNPSVTLTLYGKQGTAPSSLTNGTSLGSATFTDTSNESGGRTINSSDTTTSWDHVWIVISTQDNMCISEIQFYDYQTNGDSEAISTTERPGSNAFFAGRAWYAGINAQGLSNSIYFSQIIQRKEQYGYCYQANDPAGEYYNDLLVDDGGVVKILEMGSVVKLFATRSALFVFATNGIWQISGSSGAGFKATDYVVRRISNVGTVARLSFVDFKGLPLWWAEDGIYGIQFDPQAESFTAQNVTLKSIKTFYTDIPNSNRKYAKGAYDPINDYVYWIYNNSGTPYHNYDYNRVLVMNGTTGAFFPWTISSSETHGIRGIVYAIDPSLTTVSKIKFTTAYNYSGSTESVTFSETKATTYLDWAETNYSSYFVTGYKIHGDTQRFVQPNYVFVFLDTETDASLYMRAIYDYTNSGDSGKWSTAQQCYRSSLTNRDVNFRRLKVRGKGRAMQLKFYSETGKPFTCIGWSLNESQATDI